METLIGHGLRDDDIGQMQVGDTITEILINGWWLITVEECMTNDHGEGYLLELLVNSSKLNLCETGFVTVDSVMDHMFAFNWSHTLAILTLNMNKFKDKEPGHKAKEKCGWCDSTTFPHLCLGGVTELIETGSELLDPFSFLDSAPKPPKVSEAEQDKIDMDIARNYCTCPSTSDRWQRHVGCTFYERGRIISNSKKAQLRNFFDNSRS